LSRLLLRCRFDLQHKTWSLPVFDNPQDAAIALNFFARILLPADTVAPASSAQKGPRRVKSRSPLRGVIEESK
jgi:hypothetical protein